MCWVLLGLCCRYAAQFETEEIDVTALRGLTDDDLLKIGVAPGGSPAIVRMPPALKPLS